MSIIEGISHLTLIVHPIINGQCRKLVLADNEKLWKGHLNIYHKYIVNIFKYESITYILQDRSSMEQWL
jgi:hypothetical protein